MAKKNRKPNHSSERARRVVAQEAARIIVNQGVRDYRVAKMKAAERLGMSARGSLPGNGEIERAIEEHHQLFGGDSHADFLRTLREAALSAMDLLSVFTPRLVGPVLNGTADHNSAVNLHVFADSAEAVAMQLSGLDIAYKPYERKLRIRRDQAGTFSGLEFHHGEATVQATVFPIDGIRQAPLSPVDGKPMQRADSRAVQQLIQQS
jgi:hypothetical protein